MPTVNDIIERPFKPRRYRLRGPAPENSQRWKCNWVLCAHGMGLAGAGRCSAGKRGWWWDANCPAFQTEEEMYKEMRETTCQ